MTHQERDGLLDDHKESIRHGINAVLKQYYPAEVKLLNAEYIVRGVKTGYPTKGIHLGHYCIGVELDVLFTHTEIHLKEKGTTVHLKNGIKKGVLNMRNVINKLPEADAARLLSVDFFKTFSFCDTKIDWKEIGFILDVMDIYKEAIGIFPKSRREKIGESNTAEGQATRKHESPLVVLKKRKATNKKIGRKVSKPILYLNTGEAFSSQTAASKTLQVKQSTISDICRSLKNYGHSHTGKRLKRETRDGKQFMFITPTEFENFENSHIIRCVQDNLIFYCYLDAAIHYNTTVDVITYAVTSRILVGDKTFEQVCVNPCPYPQTGEYEGYIRCLNKKKIYTHLAMASECINMKTDTIISLVKNNLIHDMQFDCVTINNKLRTEK